MRQGYAVDDGGDFECVLLYWHSNLRGGCVCVCAALGGPQGNEMLPSLPQIISILVLKYSINKFLDALLAFEN